MDNLDNNIQEQEQEKKRRSIAEVLNVTNATAPALIIAAIALIFSMATATAVVLQNSGAEEAAQVEEVQTLEPIHEHEWMPNVTSINHEAETEEVEHEAIWEEVTTYHTVCNECHSEIDGMAQEHIADTGHSGYTTNVPLTKPVLVKDAWVETVTVTEPYVEVITDGTICSICGETKAFVDPAEVQ